MSKKEPHIPLSIPSINGRAWCYLKECLDTGWVSSAGNFVNKFEEEVSKFVDCEFAVSCINGTAGLFIALKLSGVGEKEEVIVPTLTFIAPVNAVKYLGAEPVFMDCDDYLNLDPDKLREFCKKECRFTKGGLRNKKTGRIIRGIVAVHIFGNPCNMEEIMRIAKEYGLKVIEDATESLGSYYTQGAYRNRFTGTIGDFGVYSFNGNKIVTAGGGGMVVTADKKSAQKAKYLTNQAKDEPVKAIHNEIGYNFRLNNLQAALGIAQIEQLNTFIKIKKINSALYEKELKNTPGLNLLKAPEGTRPNYWFYSLLIEPKKYGRDNLDLMEQLAKRGIETRPVWYLNHLQRPYIKNQAYRIKRAFWFWKRVLNIPCSSNLTEGEVKKVALVIRRLKR